MLVTVEHTNFDAQRDFLSLPNDDKLLRIWLNGRETNGKVADVIRDMALVKRDLEEDIKPTVAQHERWMIRAAAVSAAFIAAGPAIFFLLGKLWN